MGTEKPHGVSNECDERGGGLSFVELGSHCDQVKKNGKEMQRVSDFPSTSSDSDLLFFLKSESDIVYCNRISSLSLEERVEPVMEPPVELPTPHE